MVETNDAVGELGDGFRSWLEQWRRQGAHVVMMLSATWSAKAWPCGHAVSLYRELEKRGRNPLIVTGPGDRVLEDQLRRELPATAFAPPTNLLELSRLLAEARLFVGTDCGPRHLAASLGVPTVTLFGPTDPVGWNPADPSHVSVRTGEECSPCDLADCPVPGHPCMTNLSPDMAVRAVERVLERQAVGKVVS
jgi:ADP-heptose:LPS heptosyltransferase